MASPTETNTAASTAAQIPLGGGYANSSERCHFEVDGESYKLTKTKILILQAVVASQGSPMSRGEISKAAGCCLKTVVRCMTLFKRAGLVEVVANHHENGGQTANSYVATKAARDLLAACEPRCATTEDQFNAPAFQPAAPIRPDP